MQIVPDAFVILLVEDESLIRTMMAQAFEESDFEIIEAASADEAVSVLERLSAVRLVFTDITMPGSMDGLDLARYVKERWPDVGVLVTSGRPLPPNRLPSGCSFIPKPYKVDAVIDRALSIMKAEC